MPLAPSPTPCPPWALAPPSPPLPPPLPLHCWQEGDFSEWYAQVVVESEMISYYDVSGGCAAARQQAGA